MTDLPFAGLPVVVDCRLPADRLYIGPRGEDISAGYDRIRLPHRCTPDRPCDTRARTDALAQPVSAVVAGWRLRDGRTCLHVRLPDGVVQEIVVGHRRN